MPLINIKLAKPMPNDAVLADLASEITQLMATRLGKNPARVVINFEAIEPAHIAFGGSTVAALNAAALEQKAAAATPKWQRDGSGELVKIGVISCSDRASAGEYEDISGPAAYELAASWLANPLEGHYRLLPDNAAAAAAAISELAAIGCAVIFTTGGTGPDAKDVTPEATKMVCDRELAGFGELMRAASLKYVPTAILSRQLAAVRDHSLVINLPGKPKAIAECLEPVWPAVPYACDLIGAAFMQASDASPKIFRPKK